MNQPQKPKIAPFDWEKLIKFSKQVKAGEIIIKIQDNTVVLVEFRQKAKPDSLDDFVVFPL
jgi:hypothetical protein